MNIFVSYNPEGKPSGFYMAETDARMNTPLGHTIERATLKANDVMLAEQGLIATRRLESVKAASAIPTSVLVA